MLLYGVMAVSIGKSLFLAKKNSITMIVWLLIAIINLVSNFMLVPSAGIIAAAISTAVSYAIGFVIMLYFAIRYFDFEVDWMAIAKTIIASLVMSIAVVYLHPMSIISLIYTIILGFLVYVVTILALRTINNAEIKLLKTLTSVRGYSS
jgi:O-antigen/teichoic acid export membrane protein